MSQKQRHVKIINTVLRHFLGDYFCKQFLSHNILTRNFSTHFFRNNDYFAENIFYGNSILFPFNFGIFGILCLRLF